MERLSSNNTKLQYCFSFIHSIEPKLIEEKLLCWSSSLWNKLTYNDLRGCCITIGRLLEPNNVESKLLSWSSSASSYIENNPIIFSVPIGSDLGGNERQTYVNLPYLGAVSLDTFLFSSSAILSRAYMFWRTRQVLCVHIVDEDNRKRQTSRIAKEGNIDVYDCDDSDNRHTHVRHTDPRSPPVKATIVKGYKDQSLYKTMKECQDVRKSLRRVVDPEVARKEKKRILALQNVRHKVKGKDSSDGYLGMSPGSLQDARNILTQIKPDRMKTKKAKE